MPIIDTPLNTQHPRSGTDNMSIEIKPSRPAPVTGNNAKANGSAGQAIGETPAGPAASDTVTVTQQAERLQQLEQTLADAPAIDEQRVAEIRQALANGQYRVDADRIAEKLMKLEQGLS